MKCFNCPIVIKKKPSSKITYIHGVYHCSALKRKEIPAQPVTWLNLGDMCEIKQVPSRQIHSISMRSYDLRGRCNIEAF